MHVMAINVWHTGTHTQNTKNVSASCCSQLHAQALEPAGRPFRV
jgi:hypothetical protein